MGGPMSVNDELEWIPGVLGLIRAAVAKDVPVLGHCLGGQLISKALGGTVSRTTVKEIGWGQVNVAADAVAQAWFGPGCDAFVTFQWHGETFSVPRGATPVLSSPWCQNQGFALGPHLGLQCHIEMTAELVRSWCEAGTREIARRARCGRAAGRAHSRQPGCAPRRPASGGRSGLCALGRWTQALTLNRRGAEARRTRRGNDAANDRRQIGVRLTGSLRPAQHAARK